MKRFAVLVVLTVALVVALPGALFAQSSNSFTSYYQPGNVAASIEAGASFGYYGFSLAAYPSLEFMIAKYNIGDVIPLDIGAEVRGRVGLGIGSYAGFGLGVGGLATAHMGFRGMPGDLGAYLSKIDLYIGLGLAYDFQSSYYNSFGLGFVSIAGLNYFLSDSMAVVLGEAYWHGFADTTIGLRLKFGSAEAAKKAM
ncbi:MAG TPA: hypothetical protein VMW69_06115 [Spirochaetia bacterium]|nr:hypothetical protein [Spirochaetia bacterium]